MSGGHGALFDQYDRLAKEDDLTMSECANTDTFGSLAGQAANQIYKAGSTFCRGDEDGGAGFEIGEALDTFIAKQFHDVVRKEYERGIVRCESPIERRIFPWLLCQSYKCFTLSPCVLLDGEQDRLQPFTVAIVPQLKIGSRRVDFALAARRHGPIRFVIVECDGEKFHADVHKDVARDAELMRYNRVLDVHPITGSDIWKDVRRAASGASDALTNAWSRTNQHTRAKFEASRAG